MLLLKSDLSPGKGVILDETSRAELVTLCIFQKKPESILCILLGSLICTDGFIYPSSLVFNT